MARRTKSPPASKRPSKTAAAVWSKSRIEGGTIPHQVKGHFGAGSVVLIPASPGTGIIAGSAVRSVCEAAGIHDLLTKCYGSTNPVNLVKAAIDALQAIAHPPRCRAVARSLAVMNIHDVNKGIHKHKKRTAHRTRSRLGARQDVRPRAQRTRPVGRLVGPPGVRRGADAVGPAGSQTRLSQPVRGRRGGGQSRPTRGGVRRRRRDHARDVAGSRAWSRSGTTS